jgi:hypothetical protein
MVRDKNLLFLRVNIIKYNGLVLWCQWSYQNSMLQAAKPERTTALLSLPDALWNVSR